MHPALQDSSGGPSKANYFRQFFVGLLFDMPMGGYDHPLPVRDHDRGKKSQTAGKPVRGSGISANRSTSMMGVSRGVALILLLATLFPLEAGAVLGGSTSSVDTDQVRMKAARREARVGDAYSVQEITLPSGTVIREWASSSTGRVFAVAWSGPFMPDLKQVLGEHFDSFVEAANKAGANRRGLSVQRSDLVIHSRGHMRAFTGMAFLPGQLPEGVHLEDFQ
jgi:hypothetical protein